MISSLRSCSTFSNFRLILLHYIEKYLLIYLSSSLKGKHIYQKKNVYICILLETCLAHNILLIDWVTKKVGQMDDNNYSFDWQNGRTLNKRHLKYRETVRKRKGT